MIPNFWDTQERLIKPDVKDLQRLRFLTTTTFPPFSYIDNNKRLSGFHVDLARAICTELELISVCQIQALPFADLEKELNDGGGDAILAGTAVTPSTRSKLEFSRPYFQLPARFVAKSGGGFVEPMRTALAGKMIGIVDGTAHSAYAQAAFGNLQLRLFDTQTSALKALEKDQIAAVFSDALSLAFWLQSKQDVAKSEEVCCSFVGGPYLSSAYFGRGLAVAVAKDNVELKEAIDYALRSINDKGIFAELYLRYFPISLF